MGKKSDSILWKKRYFNFVNSLWAKKMIRMTSPRSASVRHENKEHGLESGNNSVSCMTAESDLIVWMKVCQRSYCPTIFSCISLLFRLFFKLSVLVAVSQPLAKSDSLHLKIINNLICAWRQGVNHQLFIIFPFGCFVFPPTLPHLHHTQQPTTDHFIHSD